MSEEPQYFKYHTRNKKRKGPKKILTTVLILMIAVGLGIVLYLGIQKLDKQKNQKEEITPTSTPVTTKEPSKEEDTSLTKQKKAANDKKQKDVDLKEEKKKTKTVSGFSDKTLDLLKNDKRVPVKVKGIYVTGPRAGSDEMETLIQLVDETELNAMIIDVKNDSGEITYDMDNDMVKQIKAVKPYVHDMEGLIKSLKEKDIYLIARVVAFKDPILAEKKQEYSLKNKDGSIFRDKDGLAWVNPYNKNVWKYLVSVGKEAARLGFDEIQFDYIRFSTDKGMSSVDFGSQGKGKKREDAIYNFTKYAYEQLLPLGVFVSADVYGAIINSDVDAEIVGQDYSKMAGVLDYICPMVYPSHYGDGAYGIEYPDTEPYQLILKAMTDSKHRLEETHTGKHQAIVRPWLQDFTASWLKHYIKYEKKEVEDQIKAVYKAGYEEWIFWNGSNRYTKEAFQRMED